MSRSAARRPTTGKPTYRCAGCGWQTSKWAGRCGECQAWGTVEEAGVPLLRSAASAVAAGPVTAPATPIADIRVGATSVCATGLDELDRVLGGGMVPGAVTLLAGEPGVGKSTLLLEVAALWADRGRVLYVTGEESANQVRMRADRIGAAGDRLYLAAETDLSAVLGHIEDVRPGLLVVDSVQAVASPEADGVPGGVTQVREVAGTLMRVAKERGLTTVLVGHVTKDGSVAGPRLLEHLVDVVLHFEGDRHARLRIVRAVKNRFGPTDEIGCFELSDLGIIGVPDPSGLFVSRHAAPVPGTCVTATIEGRRPLVSEVQALVATAVYGNPRRTTSGLDGSRVAMILAVLERRAGVRLGHCDVYAATVGGARLGEPAVDLAVALATASAACDVPLPPDLVAVGEVGLAGEIRPVAGVDRRLAEARRLGFVRALVPAGAAGDTSEDVAAEPVADVRAALHRALAAQPR